MTDHYNPFTEAMALARKVADATGVSMSLAVAQLAILAKNGDERAQKRNPQAEAAVVKDAVKRAEPTPDFGNASPRRSTRLMSVSEWWATIRDGTDNITIEDIETHCGLKSAANDRGLSITYGKMIESMPGAVRLGRRSPEGNFSAWGIHRNGRSLSRFGKNLSAHRYLPK